ncbi:unnamed protein product [Somion occarium]|uniref:Cystathionine gamma-synthase n=1 Tax=Somion occarium TaxID=3059160 RepID=A0ABP1DLQ7_9APHY
MTQAFVHIPMGTPLPQLPHAISVSIPTWKETWDYKRDECNPKMLDRFETGYPRYFIHRSIEKLARICEAQFGSPSETSLLIASRRAAEACRDFLTVRKVSSRVISLRVQDAHFTALFFNPESYDTARLFWELTGLGVSSRCADQCLESIAKDPASLQVYTDSTTNGHTGMAKEGEQAKAAVRHRISGLLSQSSTTTVADTDVFLYPTGMSAVWFSHQLCLGALGERPSVCFGFPYTDTLKILHNWCSDDLAFYPDGSEASIDRLEELLAARHAENPSIPPILALFTELPSNPLLRSVNLPRLRKLANQYDFVIVVDETVGNFANVDILPYTDIIASSLSKTFSGAGNVMGGSLVLNPAGKHYTRLSEHIRETYEDLWFSADAIVMEQNSRDFAERMRAVSDNAAAVAHLLRDAHPIITEVFYPEWQTTELYNACRRPGAGYGGLFSLHFVSPACARAFYDTLPCAKGPSFGTNFTLACFYTVLAHYYELEWAEGLGVGADLVRISIGLEDREEMLGAFKSALEAARKAYEA